MNVKVTMLVSNNRVPGQRLDKEQHQQAAGEVEKVRNSVTCNFHHLWWCNLG